MNSLLRVLIAIQGADGLPVAPTHIDRSGVIDIENPDLPDSVKAELRSRIAIVREYEQHLRAGTRIPFRQLAAKHGRPEWKVRELWHKYARKGEAALRHNARAGGSRLPKEVRDQICDLHYKQRKLTPKEIFDHPSIVRLRRDLGVRIKVRRVRDYIRSLPASPALDAQRAGRRRAPKGPYRGSVEWRQAVRVPFTQFQTDLFELDIFLKASDGVSLLPRPWLLSVIDVATRLIVRWRICVRAASEQDYLKTIVSALTPPHDLCAQLGLDPAVYPVYGIPQLIVADNGWTFISRRAHEQLLACGVDACHTPEWEAPMKGIVERVQGTLNTGLIHRLPGTTKSGKDAIGTDVAMTDARKYGLTLPEFERHLGRWIIGSYSHFAHSALDDASPMDRWLELTARYGRPRTWPEDPPSRLKLDLMWLRRSDTTRLLDPRGYHIFDRYYLPEEDELPDEAWLLFDPDDVRKVHVEGLDGSYHGVARAPSLRRTHPVSLEDLKTEVSPFDADEQEAAEANAQAIFEEVEKRELPPRAAARREHRQRARDETVRRGTEAPEEMLPEGEDLNFDLDGAA
jgi:transposase InsO family protein